jgi:NlpC/P60 family
MAINGVALSAVAAGSLLIWSGIKGWNLTTTAAQVITGKVPSGSDINLLSNNSSDGSSASGATPTGSAVADKALSYNGHAYVYGGAPGKDGKSPWDCSSFCNWIIGHDFNHAIPGASNYDGTSHGPPTGSWMVWPGLTHIPFSQCQAGDIIVWVTHMGIATSPTQMISALNSSLGTKQTGIDGTASGPFIVGRLK